MNPSTLIGHTVKSLGSRYSREEVGSSYKDKLNKLSNILKFKVSNVTKVLLVADLADQVNYYIPYIDAFRSKTYEVQGATFVDAVYSILPSSSLEKFIKTLRSHYVGLKGMDKELCLELIVKYIKKFPDLREFLSDVLTGKDYELI